MSRWEAYLTNAANVIRDFDGRVPLSGWLKDYFRLNRQMGSTDRKIISQMIYSCYRLGFALRNIPVKERILSGLFLCSHAENKVLEQLKPEWNMRIQENATEKIAVINQAFGDLEPTFSAGDIFPWKNELSKGIDPALFNQSFLQQPDLFLRLRPGREDAVLAKLKEAAIPFTHPFSSCVSLPNTTNAASLLDTDVEAVIQDYSSQRTGDFLPLTAASVWDCCSGSGGKSIMAFDLIPGMELTVSDVRSSILQNLEVRFQKAGIKQYTSFVSDLSQEDCTLPGRQFDLVIADLPCTGSGTWARTPEQLYFFDPSKILHYSKLQKKILSNAVKRLKPGGRLVYITCSVFKKENEEVANYISKELRLRLDNSQVLEGYQKKADSMFVAVFTNIR